ncbi:hypothetical protein SCLCIDRAFT_635692 [Scleroderma citrinum Foug A]|uniref:Uncharacterized protein n=1 Tax=Scleroderma citrinum Foug A TaxID=1036808 RepID=A0A0C2ZEY7_9AGAM|nr:hypothetical protein SCLCIDRAFT_635692 [Scleroderma citrinum Foug A]
MLHKGEVMLPLCELCFDVFANRLDFGKTVSFLQVTSEEHLTSYGRPFGRESGTHYSALHPRSCWVAPNINVNLSQARKSSRVSLNESPSNFSPLCMPHKHQTWRRGGILRDVGLDCSWVITMLNVINCTQFHRDVVKRFKVTVRDVVGMRSATQICTKHGYNRM